MGEVVQLRDYQTTRTKQAADSGDSLVPIEFAVGFTDRNQSLAKITEYGIRALHIRMVNDEPDTLLYLMGVRDAIWLNKKIIEVEAITDEEIAKRIDLIQMMENANLALMHNMWESFTQQSNIYNR